MALQCLVKWQTCVTDAAVKAIHEAEAEEMRAKKAAQKAAFDAQVRTCGCFFGCFVA